MSSFSLGKLKNKYIIFDILCCAFTNASNFYNFAANVNRPLRFLLITNYETILSAYFSSVKEVDMSSGFCQLFRQKCYKYSVTVKTLKQLEMFDSFKLAKKIRVDELRVMIKEDVIDREVI